MTLIHVPRPPKSSMNPNRPVNALLKAQIQHLQDAELILPIGQQTDIYINAIKTEGEAAEYIRKVTVAIHDAHGAAATKRARPVVKRKRGIAIAAAADKPPARKGPTTGRGKRKSKVKRGRKP